MLEWLTIKTLLGRADTFPLKEARPWCAPLGSPADSLPLSKPICKLSHLSYLSTHRFLNRSHRHLSILHGQVDHSGIQGKVLQYLGIIIARVSVHLHSQECPANDRSRQGCAQHRAALPVSKVQFFLWMSSS